MPTKWLLREREHIPIARRGELRRLATALERLRSELDGKAHIEKVTQLLAHELKSPIAALRGASELLLDERDDAQHPIANQHPYRILALATHC